MQNIEKYHEDELGFVKTPEKTVEYMISKLGKIEKSHRILDPCVGPGIFVKKLIEIGVNPSQIYAFDINPQYKNVIEELGVNFQIKDTLLDFKDEDLNQFDFIIGNPPYLNKSSKYVHKNKTDLKKIYGKINAHETYAMFIVNSIWRLRNKGSMCFIISDSYLTLRTHKNLRKFLLNNCIIDELLLAPSYLFQDQNVSTSTSILTLVKYSGSRHKQERDKNIIKVIPRIKSEDQYLTPPKINKIDQLKYKLLPFNIFYTDVEKEVIRLFEEAPKLREVLIGYIGMHTHNNKKYIAAIGGTELGDIFEKRNKKTHNLKSQYRIIDKNALELNEWKPYLKRGGNDQYYRPIMEALDWAKSARKIYDIPSKAPFEKEGIVISGISSRLAARYMPKGCYWDSNKAMGFIKTNDEISIAYLLGVLNSSLYNYFAKGIINNTSSIQLTGLHSLPLLLPTEILSHKIEKLVEKIIERKKHNLEYDYIEEQREIDQLIYEHYANRFELPDTLKEKLDSKFSCYSKT